MTFERIACVMSGGGAKAAAHVGAYRALRDAGLTPHRLVGTSMGAVVAACFAAGQSYEQVLSRMVRLVRRDVARPSPALVRGPWAGSLLSGRVLHETIAELVGVEQFDELDIPLTVTATDANTGELALFGHGGWDRAPLVDALYASCALPVYYPPGFVNGREYIDGGIRSVLPLDIAFGFDPDLVVAVSIGPTRLGETGSRDAKSLLHAHNRSVRLQMAVQTEREIQRWSDAETPFVLVRPRRNAHATFALADVVSYVEEGYRATTQELEGISAA
jgi:NTE family protein